MSGGYIMMVGTVIGYIMMVGTVSGVHYDGGYMYDRWGVYYDGGYCYWGAL